MLEGGEGCGKDTQAKLLKEYFESKGLKCNLTREPGGTPFAEKIGERLKDKTRPLGVETELTLFQLAREDNYEKVVIPFKEAGEGVLIKTRGWPSTFAYQGFGGKMDVKYIEDLNMESTKEHFPDLLLIIDIPSKKGLEREVLPDRFAEKGLDYHERVREGYLWVAKKYSDISVVVPYTEGIEKMQNTIRGIIHKRLSL